MRRSAILFVLLPLAFPAAADAPLRHADFAYGIAIETASDAPFHEFTVHRTSASPCR